MSEENVEVALRAFDAWNRGDYEAWIKAFDTECEFSPLRAQLEGQPYRGHDGLRQFMRDVTDEWESVRFGLSDIRDTGDQLVGLLRFKARGRISQAELDLPIGVVASVRDGKIFRVRMYSDPAEALEAAGLSE
jgi:ketosteroid isomerase-like protein